MRRGERLAAGALLAGMVLLMPLAGTPQAPPAPAPHAAAPRILTGEQLKAALDAKQRMVVVDTRTPDEFAQVRVAGAVNIPAGFVQALSNRLPRDKGMLIVFYCRGLGCTLSPEAAREAAALGHTNLAIYQAGIPDWLLKGYPIEKGLPARP
jgi:rhodanese-related sulfurtransferase